ncbi:hypothetical protein DFH29DRAFT_490831 [Suillus ampliporus]|nr:hypothetical protein DFH29DRAFT_490831 [Suillus ampliporus]
MAGFLRRFANKKNAGVEQHAIPAPSKPVVDAAPPSLPPLFARFATTTLEEPDPTSIFDSYISSPMSPPPPPNQLAGEWDAWKALIEDAPVEPLPAPPPPKKEPTRILHLPITRRKYTGPGLPPQIKAPDSPDATNAYYTTQSRPSTAPSGSTPRPIRAASIRQDRIEQPSNTRNSLVVQSTHFTSPVKHPRPLAPEIPSPVTIPHPSPHPPSLSLDNQAPSYTPLKTRYSHPASQDSQPAQPNRFRENPIPIQKPSSSSSHTSSTTHSSSNHTDATRFKRSGSFTSAFTSTSSIAPAIKTSQTTIVCSLFHISIGRSAAECKYTLLPPPSSSPSFACR